MRKNVSVVFTGHCDFLNHLRTVRIHDQGKRFYWLKTRFDQSYPIKWRFLVFVDNVYIVLLDVWLRKAKAVHTLAPKTRKIYISNFYLDDWNNAMEQLAVSVIPEPAIKMNNGVAVLYEILLPNTKWKQNIVAELDVRVRRISMLYGIKIMPKTFLPQNGWMFWILYVTSEIQI